MTKKIGIMGGTFNPIHTGHLILAEYAYEYFKLDEILFIPSGTPYMKEHILDAKTRISMTGIAIENNPHFALSTIEVDREGNSYSYETVASLKQNNPTYDYYFIVGADSLFSIDKWMHPEKLLAECVIIAAIREGYDQKALEEQAAYLRQQFDADIRLLSIGNIDISSTGIRKRVGENLSIRYMVPDNVLQYIQKNKLYQAVISEEDAKENIERKDL